MKHSIYRRVDTKGLKFKIWRYFVLFAAAIMVLLWLLQIVFLKTYYQSMKTLQIQKIGDTIVAAYGTDSFSDTVSKLSFNNGLMVQVLDETGTPLNDLAEAGNIMQPPRRVNPLDMSALVYRLSQSPNGRVSYISNDPRVGGQTLTYGALLSRSANSRRYLYINAQIAPVDATSTVLQTQLVIVTVIALLLSLAISLLIAAKLSRPIIRITQIAGELACGNLKVEFPQGDYTEINQLAATMNHMTIELAKTETLQRELISNISHDLRTPLTMVKMYAELIRDISGDQPEKRGAHAQIIIDEADRLSLLITDILDLSKIQAGTIDMRKTTFDLGGKTRVILMRFQALAELDGYLFSLDCRGDTTVTADEQKIEQVLYNLIGNAVNYTGEDKKVVLCVERRDNGVRFSVTDTGKGIPLEQCAQIWERYYKAGNAHRHKTVGTGLGLSIVKGILEAHEAAHGVDSVVGKGSTFWFVL
ncbi:MAG: HAMP domain-containing sensor histidine kinase [Ethanoligenens sp.]